MTYDYKARKIVAVVSGNLESWQAMNVLGHMATALGANKDGELMGRPVLIDASGVEHVGIARYGFIVKKGNSVEIADLVRAAKKEEGVLTIDFTREMINTSQDDELVENMKMKEEPDFEYLGVVVYGPSDKINVLTKSFKLWS